MKRCKTSILLLLAAMVAVFLSVSPAQPVQAATLSISKTSMTMKVGDTRTLKVTTSLSGTVTWKSSNAKAASVSQKGKVTAKKAGSATITATIKQKSVSCNVTVKSDSMKIQAKKNVQTYQKQIKEILKYTNQYRKKAGAKVLKLDTTLTRAACYRSLEQAKTNTMSHIRPDGTTPFTILEEYNISYSTAGENIGMSSGLVIKLMVENWYNSPGHRANMLNTDFGKIGIGIAYANNGSVYYTQLFTN